MASFEIVEVTATGNVSLTHLGIFPDGKMAASAVQSMLLFNPEKKYQPRPIMVSADWRKRELAKNHPPLPWGDALRPITDHFACVSDKDPEQVSYFGSENSGKLDRRINTHVNRYLLEFYSGLDVDARRRLVWQFTGQNPVNALLFASTEDDISRVYRRGPNSCMSHRSSFYASSYHPTKAYAGPDLQLAYVEDDDGDPVARTVVWPEKKIFARIYGDEEKLLPELKKLGYRYSRVDFEGARLSLTEDYGRFDEDDRDCEGYICPYIDFAESVEPIDGYLVVTRKGTYDCKFQSGIAERNAKRCPHCSQMRNAEAFYEIDGESICEDCAFPHFKVDAMTGGYLNRNDANAISGGRYVANYNYQWHTFVCLGNGQRYLNTEVVLHQGNKYSEEGLAQFLKERTRAA